MSLEVFIAYSLTKTPISKLGTTLEAWDMPDYEPVAIQVKDPTNEKLVHVAAEAIAKGDYIIAPLGSKPPDGKFHKKGQGIKVEACSPRVQ